jgi:hypothetical protein
MRVLDVLSVMGGDWVTGTIGLKERIASYGGS